MSDRSGELKLKWYQRIHIDAQKKLVGKASKDRIIAIDWCKGIAIIALCFYHLEVGWVISQDWWLVRSIIFVWFFGPTTFLFYAGINIALSYRIGREKNVPFKKMYVDILRRMLGLLIVSTTWNVATNGVLFRWEILQCIVFSTVLAFPLLKLSTVTRFFIACLILAMGLPLYAYLVSIQSQSILAQGILFAIFDPYLQSPLIPTMALTLIGTVVIDVLYPLIKQKSLLSRNNEDLRSNAALLKRNKSYLHFKILLIISLSTIIVCILLGLGPNLDPVFQAEHATSLQELHTSPLYAGWEYIPDFLVRLSPIDYVYDLAIVLSLFLLVFYYFSILRQDKNTPSKVTQTINFLGQFSLSYFTYGFIFTLSGPWANSVNIWFGFVGAMIVLTLCFKFLLRKAYAGGLIEWIMVFCSVKWTGLPDVKDIQAVYPEKVTAMIAHLNN